MAAVQPSTHVVDVDVRSFQAEVVERSKELPVFVLFWAQQVPVSAETRGHLERLAEAYGGKFRLARVDVAKDPTLAQHLRVQNLPSIKVVRNGQIADEVEGPQGERVLRQMIDTHTMSSGELVKQELGELLLRQDFGAALNLVRQALLEEPHNPVLKVELADLLAQTGELDEAEQTLLTVPENADERERPRARIDLLREVASLPDKKVLQQRVAAGNDLDALHDLALRLAAEGQYEGAMEQALALLSANRTYREELGRRTLVRLFNLLPKGNELVKRYRRQLFARLH